MTENELAAWAKVRAHQQEVEELETEITYLSDELSELQNEMHELRGSHFDACLNLALTRADIDERWPV